MKKCIAALLVFTVLVTIWSCTKDTDNAAKWVGIYTSTGSVADSVNQVTITEVNSSTLQLQLQSKYNGVVYTSVTIQNAKLATATAITINENGTIAGLTATYTFTGSGSLNGNVVTISGQGVNTTNSSDVRLYNFVGSK